MKRTTWRDHFPSLWKSWKSRWIGLKGCLKKFKCYLNSNCKFRVLYYTNKVSFYCNIKDKVPHVQRNHMIYKIKWRGSSGCYTGKIEMFNSQNYWHGTKETETVFKYLVECELLKHCCWYSLLSLFNEDEHEDISWCHIFTSFCKTMKY